MPNRVRFGQTMTKKILEIEINLRLKKFYKHRPLFLLTPTSRVGRRSCFAAHQRVWWQRCSSTTTMRFLVTKATPLIVQLFLSKSIY